MKKIAILILFIILFSCKKEIEYYDVEAPKFIFSAQINDKVLFQFDEPVKEFKCLLKSQNDEKETIIINKFPVANVLVNKLFFKEKGELTITAKDSQNNTNTYQVPKPIINDNPATLIISDIQLKYSQKKPQNFTIKVIKGGNINGFSICFFINNDIYEYFFNEETVKAGEKLTLFINPNKESYSKNDNIKFSGKIAKLTTKMRISSTSSLLCIKKQDIEIIDYIIFYDSKNNSLEFYKNKNNFKTMIHLLNSYEIDPVFVDIKGNTIKKHIIRLNNKYSINSSG